MVSQPSANWEAIANTFYRKQDIYSMQWSLRDLDDYLIAGARWGGPIAVMRDPQKPVLVEMGRIPIGKPKISIYSSSGGLLQTIIWDAPSLPITLGWTLNESLVILTQDGTYRIYPLSVSSSSTSAPYSQHSLGSEASDNGVRSAKIYEGGMVALLSNNTFVSVRSWESSISPNATNDGSLAGIGVGGKVQVLPSAGLMVEPNAWEIIQPEFSQTRGIEVVISVGSTILKLDEIEVLDLNVTRGPFTHILPSPNAHFLALLSSSNQLWVTTIDFSRSLSEFDLTKEGEGQVRQVTWCGNNTVVVSYEDGRVIMVGPFGETLKYYYDGPVHLVGEIDGTRIISRDSCEFLQIVPQASQDIFSPGSSSPPALLYDSYEHFLSKSPKSDELIRSIRPELVLAVDTCIDAAGREFESPLQKKLLEAASFGKSYLEGYNPSEFVGVTKVLRVLNAARFYEVGIPLTYDQYQSHPPSHLISRLLSRSLHLLALRISQFLQISTAPVLKHWAQAQIKSKESDEYVCKIVVDKLRDQKDVSCAEVARGAWEEGRNGLATKLLDHEVMASKQVPLLLNMKEEDLALVKAIESGDPNLVYSVLLALRRAHALGDFFRFVDNKPDAANLLQVYAKENDVEMLRDFYYQDDRRRETAVLSLVESIGLQDFGEKVAKVRAAQKAFNEDKDCAFEAKMIDDQIKLLALQQSLEQEAPGKTFVGLSINETIRTCVISGLPKKADKVKSDFKVPDKRFWYVKMKSLIEVRDWEGLEAFAKSKRSPIGYQPWVEQLVSTGNHRQAVGYVARCDRNRVELYVKCGEWVMAGQECVRRSDRGRLIELRQRCPNNVIGAQLDQLLEELQNGGT